MWLDVRVKSCPIFPKVVYDIGIWPRKLPFPWFKLFKFWLPLNCPQHIEELTLIRYTSFIHSLWYVCLYYPAYQYLYIFHVSQNYAQKFYSISTSGSYLRLIFVLNGSNVWNLIVLSPNNAKTICQKWNFQTSEESFVLLLQPEKLQAYQKPTTRGEAIYKKKIIIKLG